MPNFVQLYRSTDLNAPVLNGQVGSLINLLNRVLVDGYTAAALTSLSRNGNVATATITVPNGTLLTGDYVQISGATPSYYNGIFQITALSSTSFSYTLPFDNYDLEVLDDDPVLYYRMSAPSGTSEPSLGSNTTAGTYTGTYTLAEPEIVSSTGASVRFQGSSAAGRLNSNVNTNYTAFCTLECWIRPEASGHGTGAKILNKISYFANSTNDFPIYLGFDPVAFKVQFGLSSGNDFNPDEVLESAVLTPSQVYHVVGVYRANGLCELYINGVLADSATIGFTISSTTYNWSVGAATPYIEPATSSTFNGQISDAAVYDKALAQADVERHFLSGFIQSVTGTLLYNKAPLGWTRPFTAGTNAQTYRSADVTTNRFYLQVIDNGSTAGTGREAQVYGAEEMSADQTVTSGRFPTTTQMASGMCWRKSDALTGDSRPWSIIGDGRTFYLQTVPTGAIGNTTQLYGFGFFHSLKPTDGYNTFIAGGSAFNTASTLGGLIAAQPPASTGTATVGLYVARPVTGVLGAVNSSVCGFGGTFIGGTACIGYPNNADNGFYVNPVFVGEPTLGTTLRGRFPGFYNPLHAVPLVKHDLVSGITGLPGITLIAMVGSSSTVGCGMFDRFGPWN
jgi:hypothetical protein